MPFVPELIWHVMETCGEFLQQARLDSNQDTQDQNLMCYRYTTGL